MSLIVIGGSFYLSAYYHNGMIKVKVFFTPFFGSMPLSYKLSLAKSKDKKAFFKQ